MTVALLPHVRDTGTGPALVFLHAFPLDGSQWDPQVAALSGEYRCLRPDIFGCGDSPGPPLALSLAFYAESVLAALDARDIDDFVLIGLSMGGYTAFPLLRLAGPRVRGLLLADTRATADTDEARTDRLAMAERVRHEGSQSIVEPMVTRLLAPTNGVEFHISDPVRARIRHCTPAGIAAGQEAMANRPDSSDILPTISVPTLVLVGSEDNVTPPTEMQAMAASIPGAHLEVIAGAGHLSNLERSDPFTTALRALLARVF